MKSEKWKSQALKKTLVCYIKHTIYRVYIKEQKKVIWSKDIRILQDYKAKKSTNFPEYSDNILTFWSFH